MMLEKKRIWIIIAIALIVLAVLLLLAWTYLNGRNGPVWQFILDPEAHQDWVTPQLDISVRMLLLACLRMALLAICMVMFFK